MSHGNNPPWDDDWPREGEFLYEYRSSLGEYAYHLTDRENAASIRERGILCEKGTSRDTEKISSVLEEHGYADRFPFDRDNVVYCNVRGGYVAEMQREEDEELFGLNPYDVVVVVDLDSIDAPTFLADSRVITDLTEFEVAPDKVTLTDSVEEAVSLYEESIERVESPVDIFTYPYMSDGHPELIVDGDVPPDAIVDICDLAPDLESLAGDKGYDDQSANSS